MLKRKIESQLVEWKKTEKHKPLVVKGCRQCGKTSSVQKFAYENYDNVVYVNFYEDDNLKNIFSGSMKIDNITMMLSALLGPDTKIEAGNTVFIFDEIQECPNARTSLKFFFLDGRYDVICTGSLLGIKGYGKEIKSVPVGFETVITMYPMDFEEFLWANGVGEDLIQLMKKHLEDKSPIEEALHTRYKQLLLQYVVVGGMPDVVQTFVNTNSMNQVLKIQRNIVASYEEDMIKYADKKDKSLINQCFRSIPNQLAKENKKFQYSFLKKGSTASRYAGSLQWIEDAGIITRCKNLNTTELPLEGNAIEDVFKVYMVDTGLFVSMLEEGTQFDILTGNLLGYKGAIYENLIADIFTKMGRKLYYFRKDSGLEIDFFIRYKGKCMPVEVKAVSGKTKSLKTVLNNKDVYHLDYAIKMGDYNIGEDNNILTIPLYLGFLLTDR